MVRRNYGLRITDTKPHRLVYYDSPRLGYKWHPGIFVCACGEMATTVQKFTAHKAAGNRAMSARANN